ncbi:MAG: nucleoside-diphosphate sugar epimerase/dehydratase [Caldilinea sp.]|uniref:polysaccharide biosynthesis protein n=1 Tax=Caldilinea sp. TaxID=2293560 RepID=UPI00309F6B7E
MKSDPVQKSSTPALTGLRVRYLMAIDLAFILLAGVCAFVIRYEALISVWPYLKQNWIYFLLAPMVRLPIYYGFHLYNRMWRYASIVEMKMIMLAATVSSFLIFALNFGALPMLGIPYMPSRSIWLLESILSLGALAGSRFLLRLIQERYRPHELLRWRAFIQNPSHVLIVGAGDAGAMVLREIQNNRMLGLHVVGFVDDDPAKRRLSLNGVPVLGDRQAIPELVKRHNIDQVIIAMPTASGSEIRQIVRICEKAGIQPRTVPGLYELIDGTVRLSQIREVSIEDLLRREPIRTDTAAVAGLLRNKRVLVTGAGGSIGSELCRQILRCRPAELILVGHGENSIFEIYNELLIENQRIVKGEIVITPVIADIRFRERMMTLFQKHRPEIVFHAAAHKHVPLMEINPVEAITNNIFGTRNVVEAAQAVGVQRFVMISTDKAVNPTSIMGASKRAAELVVHKFGSHASGAYMAVRFGNVLGSRGSVLLTFRKQIAAGGPVTVTHPEMRRYFMTIPEAVQLVLQAAVLGKGGEVFLLDMGEPVRIVDMATDLIRLSGLEVGRDIEIVYTGLRPGEKLYEELFVPGEEYERTRHEKVFIANNASHFVPECLDETLAALEQAVQLNDRDAIVCCLKNLIPEYGPHEERLATSYEKLPFSSGSAATPAPGVAS